jgi:hypothetical protein
MKPDADMLGALMKLRVLCQLNSALVVNEDFLGLGSLGVVAVGA